MTTEALIGIKENCNNKKIEKLINNFIFIIEFIASVFSIFFLYKIVIFKEYENIWNLKYILMFLPMSTIVLICIIWNYKKNKENIEKIFVSFLIPIGMMYVFCISPTYVPDEHTHIWKALDISQGNIVTQIDSDGKAKTLVPRFFDKYRIPNIKSYGKFNSVITEKTDYTDLVEVENPAQSYPSVLYLGSALVFFIGRILNINGIIAIYIARLLNFIIFLYLGYYSIKIIPFGKRTISLILFLPMTLQQAVSISADSFLNAITIYFICYTLFLAKKATKITIKNKIIYIVIGSIIAISKIVYLPMIGLSLLILTNKNIKKKEKNIFIGITIIITIIFGLIYFAFMQKYPATSTVQQYSEDNNVNMKEQLKNIIRNPNIFIQVIIGTINEDSFYIDTMIGKYLGWLNIEIPDIVIHSFIILLAIAPFLEKNNIEIKKLERIWNVMIYLGTYMITILAMYLCWTTLGSEMVMGVQGRYFIPILALPLLSYCNKELYIKFRNIDLKLSIIASILNMIAIVNVIKFFI